MRVGAAITGGGGHVAGILEINAFGLAEVVDQFVIGAGIDQTIDLPRGEVVGVLVALR